MPILILYTGGTIGMTRVKGGLEPAPLYDLAALLPRLPEGEYILETLSRPIDSADMQPKTWLEIAAVIKKNYEAVDGFVILHGSDTMAYTASVLSFLLEGLDKPVILTGSQLPLADSRNDAEENLVTAFQVARAKRYGKARVPEVAIYFNRRLLRGNRSTKWSSSDFDAFISPNYPLLGEAGVHLRFSDVDIRYNEGVSFNARTELDPNIASLKIVPGIPLAVVERVLYSEVNAVILEGYGSGTLPRDRRLRKCLGEAAKSGVLILLLSQCTHGPVTPGHYQASEGLLDMGLVPGGDLTYEAALAKLMFLLPQKGINIKKQLCTDLRGELTTHLK